MTHDKTEKHLLDTPILSVLHINLEVLLYIVLAIVAIAALFYHLGARTQSHDESLHALYSWKLYAGEGYEHNPMMHGPFLFHINALFYFLFGTSDFTARMSAATFGLILVLLPAFLRKELGRVGALVVAVLTLISPSTLYYARYIRNDIYMLVWALLLAIALFRYMDTRKPGWLYLGVLSVTMSLATKETAYIIGFIGFTFMVLLWVQQMMSRGASQRAFLVAAVLTIVLVMVLIGLRVYIDTLPAESAEEAMTPGPTGRGTLTKISEVVFLLIGILVTMLLGSLLIRRDERLRPALASIAAYGAAIAALLVLCAAAGGLVWLIVAQMPEGIVSPPVFVALQVVLVGAAVTAGVYVWWRLLGYVRDEGWLGVTEGEVAKTGSTRNKSMFGGALFENKVLYISLALAVIPFVLLYTTFFSNPKGLGTGTIGGITYWLAQQEVKRAGQPWFYYLIIAPLYEFLPIGLGLAAMLYYFITGRVDRPARRARGTEGALGPSLPVVAYLVYWTLSAWLIYSWAGEKMPWMMVHVVQPMILLSGRFVDDLLYGTDWAAIWRKGGAVLALLVPISLVSVGMVVGLPLFGQAFRGMSLGDLNDTSKWFFALLIGAGVLYAASRLWRTLGRSAAWRVVLVSVLVLGSLLTLRYAWMAAYINYDTAKEFLVYAHGTPDVKRTVEELQEMSRRLYGDEHSIKFAYSSDATWPFEWYFDTLFPNRVFFGREPTREATNVPVLVVGQEEIAKTEPFLGNRYYRFDRKLVWWPHQDYYMGLSLAVPPENKRVPGKNYLFLDLQDPDIRRQLWNVIVYRKYDQSLADWEPSHSFAFYVRKDIAAQLWDYGVAPTVVELSGDEDAYAKGQRPLTPVAVWGGEGSGDGQYNNPRNVAIGPDGSVYVADGGNNRIQKLAPDGQFITSWGHMCRLYEGRAGCQEADGAGGFYDPWGLAVDANGFVYVADTWNHRIQKFDADGEFVTMWGTYGVQEDAVGGEGLFWGPRTVAVGPEGNIYVTDTGNKRVQVFTPDGRFLSQWGGKGLMEGQMDEPVGLAIAPDGTRYVADTWNQRIQAFDAENYYTYMWEVDSWYGQSLENKPYLALDAESRVYATDPEGYRILVFDNRGRFLASLGRYGTEDDAFMLPTGIAVDAEGYIYVVDTSTHRVMKFAPADF